MLVLKRKPDQKPIEWLRAAIKCFRDVQPVELFNPERMQLGPALFKHAGLIEKSCHACGWPGRSIERRLKSLPLFRIQAETLAIWQGFSGTCEGTLKYKVAYRSVLGLRGDVQNALGRLGEPKVEFFCPSF